MKKIFLFSFLFLSFLSFNALFAEEVVSIEEATTDVEPTEVESSEALITEGITDANTDNDLVDVIETVQFEKDPFVESSFLLMIDPLNLRFGNSANVLDPGKQVPEPIYFASTDKVTGESLVPNHHFSLDKEAYFSLSGYFKVAKWIAVGLKIGVGYEETPFICNLQKDPKVPDSPKVPTYYDFGLWGGGAQLGSIVNDKRGKVGEKQYFYYPLFYGQVRLELAPSFQFFPLQNAQDDLKGLYIELDPFVGFDMNTSMKTYMDVIYENGVKKLVIDDPNANIPLEMKKMIHEPSNWSKIQETFEKAGDNLDPYLRFFGGATLDLGWQGILDNGMAIKTGAGIGYDNSRGFYTQIKASIGYLFR